jgi:hypothetical protein
MMPRAEVAAQRECFEAAVFNRPQEGICPSPTPFRIPHTTPNWDQE